MCECPQLPICQMISKQSFNTDNNDVTIFIYWVTKILTRPINAHENVITLSGGEGRHDKTGVIKKTL